MSIAGAAVGLAVLLLPSGLRDRYREQWHSDLRDAAEAGIPQHEIATGALAFAATVSRPLPWSGSGLPTPATVERRSRLAAALALSAALLGLAGFASINGTTGLTGTVGYDLLLELVDSLLLAHIVVAAILAVAIVTLMKATNPRVRLAVWLLVFPVLSPLAQRLVDGLTYIYVPGLGNLAYLVGAAIVVIALQLLWSGLQHPDARARPPLPTTILSALAVLAVGALGGAQAVIAWSSRIPLAWSWQPGFGGTIDEDGSVVQWEIHPTHADYAQWLAMKAEFELLANVALAAYAAAAVILAIALLLVTRAVGIRPGALAGVAIAMLLVANAALLSFLGWTLATPFVAADLLLAIGRVLLVVVVVYSVGGVRFERRRHARVVPEGLSARTPT